MVTPGTYSGWAKIYPRTDCEKSFPKSVELTFDGVRIVSLLFTLVRWLLYAAVVTFTWAIVGTADVSTAAASTPTHHHEKDFEVHRRLFNARSAKSIILLEGIPTVFSK